jgi:hypothetical protein
VIPEQPQPFNPLHQPDTFSTVSRLTFEDPEGGLPLDSPEVQAHERQQRGRPANQRPTPPAPEGSP